MRSFILKFVALILFAAVCQAADNPSRTILVIGDSLSAGLGIQPEQSWVMLLRHRLESEGYGYSVTNASISGDTTTGGLRRLPRSLEQHHPDIVLIELGGNDGLRGTPVDLIRKNLAGMIEKSQAGGARVILAGIQIPPNYGATYTDAFTAIYPALADQYDAALITFFMDGVALDPELMQADGIHPNAAGQSVLLDNVWLALKPELEEILAAVTR
jgi:acyl-CoA thioesterase-1